MSMAWHRLENEEDVPSPALLVYADRAEENIRRMIRMAGGPARLRPHFKTCKIRELAEMQIRHGISKFKCATIAEAELLARAGAADILLAVQPVGPNISRLLKLADAHPASSFACIVDDAGVAVEIGAAASVNRQKLRVYLDMDVGMGRTGVASGVAAIRLYRVLTETNGLIPSGIHAYDGHAHESDLTARTRQADKAWQVVESAQAHIEAAGMRVPLVVMGGTPTFAVHAAREGVECSPGTTVLWDFGYSSKFPDLQFLHAALVLSRVIGKPSENRLCLDLGHKAIASENPHPRVQLLGLEEAKPLMHSEEHLLIEIPEAGHHKIGDCLYGIPRHVCPTVALHSEAVVVVGGRAVDRWPVLARARSLGI